MRFFRSEDTLKNTLLELVLKSPAPESYKAALSSSENLNSEKRLTQVSLLIVTTLLGVLAATPAFANWWIVRSSDETCLVVDIEPTGKEKGITKIGKDSYPTAEQAEADVKRFARQKLSRSAIPSFEERQGALENPSLISQRSHFSRVILQD